MTLKKIKKNILNSFFHFLKLDIRNKLIKISKFTGINLYPNFFHQKGIKSIYTKIIINLILKYELRKIRKTIYKQIFFKPEKYESEKVNFLISMPSSGSTYIRLMLQSYFELLCNVGNGVPKYDNVNNKMLFSASQLVSGNLWNEIKIERGLIDNSIFINHEEFERKKFVFSRYPLNRIDLYKIDQIRPVVLFRNPFEVITSIYVKSRNRSFKKEEIDEKVLNETISKYEKYIVFWSGFFKKKNEKKDYLIINYESLVANPENIFKQILIFFNYDLNDEYIKKCSQIHTKENTLKNLKDVKIYNRIRFTDSQLKKEQEALISETLKNKIQNTNIMQIYNNLFNN